MRQTITITMSDIKEFTDESEVLSTLPTASNHSLNYMTPEMSRNITQWVTVKILTAMLKMYRITPDVDCKNCGNETSNFTNIRHDEQHDTQKEMFDFYLYTVVTLIVFGIILLTGIVGNGMVIYITVRKMKGFTVVNVLVTNLAIADLLFILLVVPFATYDYAFNAWPFGDVICNLMYYLLFSTVYVSIYSLVAVSLTRYLTLVHGNTFKPYKTKRNVIIVTILTWITTGGLNALILKRFTVADGYCTGAPDFIKTLYLSFFIFGYALPLVIIFILHVLILVFLHKNNHTGAVGSRRRNNRASQVVIATVVAFACLWLPFQVCTMVAFYGKAQSSQMYKLVVHIAQCLAYANSCVNPFLYSFVSNDFRVAFKETFTCDYTPIKQTLTTDNAVIGQSSEMVQVRETELHTVETSIT
ncbi:unnamed protein product [Owenia fusiformis]|uniref:G-protein coupled receptors family 1 profile domain-containing protein n=1 Tax=Owenia fusiformis TaxID=6347 RepID=A0A8S4PTT4_OWEFU|nr:unnamed protein product [Owenia fusiformis]